MDKGTKANLQNGDLFRSDVPCIAAEVFGEILCYSSDDNMRLSTPKHSPAVGSRQTDPGPADGYMLGIKY